MAFAGMHDQQSGYARHGEHRSDWGDGGNERFDVEPRLCRVTIRRQEVALHVDHQQCRAVGRQRIE